MSMFGGKPRVSKLEFRKVRSGLRGGDHKFNDRQIEKVENIFHGSMDEEGSMHRGIDAKEIKKGMEYVRKNQRDLGFSDNKIAKLEAQLKKRL